MKSRESLEKNDRVEYEVNLVKWEKLGKTCFGVLSEALHLQK